MFSSVFATFHSKVKPLIFMIYLIINLKKLHSKCKNNNKMLTTKSKEKQKGDSSGDQVNGKNNAKSIVPITKYMKK